MLSLKSCAESRLPADKIPPDDTDRKCRQVLLYKLAWIYYNGVGIQVPAQCAGTLAIYRRRKERWFVITRFGPAGTADSFKAMGYKKTVQLAEYLEKFGLNAFEYQCGRGVRVNVETVTQLGILCRDKDIALSLHAPYYISLSSVEEEKRDNSVGYILDSARAAKLMGADRIVVHSGSAGKMSREKALALAVETLGRAQKALDEEGLGDVIICPETMGKVNQLGDLEEVMTLCGVDERMLPTIDFGHLNARTFGSIKSQADFAAILDTLENRLGKDRASRFHSHSSKIMYTVPGGEKCHLTFADTEYGPDFEPLMELIAKRGWTPRFICESAGTQTEDAAAMMKSYQAYLSEDGLKG